MWIRGLGRPLAALSLSNEPIIYCLECPPGSACGTGAAEPSQCSPGTVAPNASMATCDRCAAGTYQADEGEKACVACKPGSYCPEGASAALPCEEGSYSGATDLNSAGQCTTTDAGFYASTGSDDRRPWRPWRPSPARGHRTAARTLPPEAPAT